MGKGKGFFLRMISRIKKNRTFLECSNLNIIFLKKIKFFFKKKTGIQTFINFKHQRQIFCSKFNITYYNLYNK
jgi:hypothetical protein